MAQTSNTGYVEMQPYPLKETSGDHVTATGLDLDAMLEPKPVHRHFFSWLVNSMTKYDQRTVTLIALQFFSEGAMFMICLTATITFSQVFWISPQRATLWLALICLPEGLSFIFGFFSDCVPVFGSQRRAYICLMSLIQTGTAIALAMNEWTANGRDEWIFAGLVSLMVMSRAWLTPVIESLMII